MRVQRPPYDATAVRPSWDELPAAVQDVVVAWVGRPVEVRSAGGGFTRGFASSLTNEGGRTLFVKAVPASSRDIAASYQREIAVHAVLPETAPAPRLLHSAVVGDVDEEWTVLAFEHVEGHMPGVPWTPDDLVLTVRALEELAVALRGFAWADDATIFGFSAGVDLAAWWTAYDASVLPDGLDRWVADHRHVLAATTARAAHALRGDDWTHCDIRGDNLVIDGSRAWVVDWNWLCRAPAWADLALLLPLVHADGVDLSPAYGSWLLADVRPEDLDAAIAWLGALMLHFADEPARPTGSPWLRPHQRWTGNACLGLLRERWSV